MKKPEADRRSSILIERSRKLSIFKKETGSQKHVTPSEAGSFFIRLRLPCTPNSESRRPSRLAESPPPPREKGGVRGKIPGAVWRKAERRRSERREFVGASEAAAAAAAAIALSQLRRLSLTARQFRGCAEVTGVDDQRVARSLVSRSCGSSLGRSVVRHRCRRFRRRLPRLGGWSQGTDTTFDRP